MWVRNNYLSIAAYIHNFPCTLILRYIFTNTNHNRIPNHGASPTSNQTTLCIVACNECIFAFAHLFAKVLSSVIHSSYHIHSVVPFRQMLSARDRSKHNNISIITTTIKTTTTPLHNRFSSNNYVYIKPLQHKFDWDCCDETNDCDLIFQNRLLICKHNNLV